MNILDRNDRRSSGLNVSILEELKNMLDGINPYIQVFRTAGEMLRPNNSVDLRLKIIYSRSGQYIQPTSNEIVALIVSEDNG